jgi:hypothetical protein
MNNVFETLYIIMDLTAVLVDGLYGLLFNEIDIGVFGSYTLFSLLFNPANLFLFMTAVMIRKLV